MVDADLECRGRLAVKLRLTGADKHTGKLGPPGAWLTQIPCFAIVPPT
jgi:hypothetical protein